jgi:hypothetical protein
MTGTGHHNQLFKKFFYFLLKWSFEHFLLKLASNYDSPDLFLTSSDDYRYESPYLLGLEEFKFYFNL